MKCNYCGYDPAEDDYCLLRDVCEMEDEEILMRHLQDDRCESVNLLKRIIDLMGEK